MRDWTVLGGHLYVAANIEGATGMRDTVQAPLKPQPRRTQRIAKQSNVERMQLVGRLATDPFKQVMSPPVGG